MANLPVILIDDEKHILDALDTTLALAGIGPVQSYTGWMSARDMVLSKPCGAVVLDLTMPNISGYEALSEICAHRPGLPVIIATGVNDIKSAVSCLRSGAFDYLVKPINGSDFVESLTAALNAHQELSLAPISCPIFDIESIFNPANKLETLPNRLDDCLRRVTESDDTDPLISRLCHEFIESNLAKIHACSLDMAAKLCATNRGSLSKAINTFFGVSFSRLVNMLRMAEYIRLATSPDADIYTIDHLSKSAGFPRRETLYRVFRELSDRSPAEFLRNH